MSVHYCLGLTDGKFAECADPWDFGPLTDELRNMGVAEPLAPLVRLPSFAWTKPKELQIPPDRPPAIPQSCESPRIPGIPGKSHLQQYGFGQDPMICAMDSWSPIGPGGGIFGDRGLADSLTGATALRSALDKGGQIATGKGVNVVIVDRGLDQNTIADTVARMARNRGLSNDHRDREVRGWPRLRNRDR